VTKDQRPIDQAAKDTLSIQLSSLDHTRELAEALAGLVGAGDLITLSGDLGAGKSEFARAIIRTRLSDENMDVPSPTFTLIQTYDEGDDSVILHCDLYRLADADELFELGLDDVRSASLLLIEWPDRLPNDWLDTSIDMTIEILPEQNSNGDQHRRVTLSAPAERFSAFRTMIDQLSTAPQERDA